MGKPTQSEFPIRKKCLQWLIPAMTFFDYLLMSSNKNGPESELLGIIITALVGPKWG